MAQENEIVDLLSHPSLEALEDMTILLHERILLGVEQTPRPRCDMEKRWEERDYMRLERLQGRLEAFAVAKAECNPSFQRDTPDVRDAIDILHLDTLQQIKELKNGS